MSRVAAETSSALVWAQGSETAFTWVTSIPPMKPLPPGVTEDSRYLVFGEYRDAMVVVNAFIRHLRGEEDDPMIQSAGRVRELVGFLKDLRNKAAELDAKRKRKDLYLGIGSGGGYNEGKAEGDMFGIAICDTEIEKAIEQENDDAMEHAVSFILQPFQNEDWKPGIVNKLAHSDINLDLNIKKIALPGDLCHFLTSLRMKAYEDWANQFNNVYKVGTNQYLFRELFNEEYYFSGDDPSTRLSVALPTSNEEMRKAIINGFQYRTNAFVYDRKNTQLEQMYSKIKTLVDGYKIEEWFYAELATIFDYWPGNRVTVASFVVWENILSQWETPFASFPGVLRAVRHAQTSPRAIGRCIKAYAAKSFEKQDKGYEVDTETGLPTSPQHKVRFNEEGWEHDLEFDSDS